MIHGQYKTLTALTMIHGQYNTFTALTMIHGQYKTLTALTMIQGQYKTLTALTMIYPWAIQNTHSTHNDTPVGNTKHSQQSDVKLSVKKVLLLFYGKFGHYRPI